MNLKGTEIIESKCYEVTYTLEGRKVKWVTFGHEIPTMERNIDEDNGRVLKVEELPEGDWRTRIKRASDGNLWDTVYNLISSLKEEYNPKLVTLKDKILDELSDRLARKMEDDLDRADMAINSNEENIRVLRKVGEDRRYLHSLTGWPL